MPSSELFIKLPIRLSSQQPALEDDNSGGDAVCCPKEMSGTGSSGVEGAEDLKLEVPVERMKVTFHGRNLLAPKRQRISVSQDFHQYSFDKALSRIYTYVSTVQYLTTTWLGTKMRATTRRWSGGIFPSRASELI